MTKEIAMDTAQAAWHIAKAHPHGLPQIRLLKLLWLAELRHFERTGKRLTAAGWWRWNHGPYSKDVINTVKADGTHFEIEPTTTDLGRNMLAIHAKAELKPPAEQEAMETLEDVLWLYREYTDEEILAEVYADAFFKDTPYSFDFDFSQLPKYRSLDLSEEEAQRLLSLPTEPVDDIAALFR